MQSCNIILFLTVNQLEEASEYLRATVGTESNGWEKALSSAPLGIATLGQLIADTCSAPDFPIDKKAGLLMKHPYSLRGTVVQIVKEAYLSLNKAQNYMEQIQLYMEQVPRHVKECAKILKSQNAVDIKIVLLGRIECIREAANISAKLSQRLSQCFHQLNELIGQVLEALSASMETAKEYQSASQTRRLMATRLADTSLGVKILCTAVNETIRNYKPVFHVRNVSTNSQVAQVRLMAAESERRAVRLKIIKGKAEKNKNKMEEIYAQYVANLEDATNQDNNNNETVILLLRQSLINLSNLKGHWVEMTLYFQSITNIITTTTQPNLEDFTEEATFAADTPSLIQLMGNSILESSLSSYLTRRIADIYVKVSNLFIIRNADNLQKMITLNAEDTSEAQKQLTDSCHKLSGIVLALVKEEREQLIPQIQDHVDQLKIEFDTLEISH